MPAFDRRARDFEAASAQVLGISTDSPFSHENWAKAVGISHYPLLSDVHRDVSKAYGVYWPTGTPSPRDLHRRPAGHGPVRRALRKGELPDPDRILAEVKKLG